MMYYSIQARDRIFVKSYGFLSVAAKNLGKNIGKNLSKNFSGRYRQKLLDHSKQSPTDAFETSSKRAIEKTVEATGIEEYMEHISPEERQKIIDDLRLM